MARVVVPEKLAPAGLDVLRKAGHDVEEHLGLTPDELAAVMPGAHALIVRSATQVDAALLAASPDLLVVGRAGVGLDNVDVETATEVGRRHGDGDLRGLIPYPSGSWARSSATSSSTGR